MAFLVGFFACIIEKVNNCGNYLGMGVNYGDGGSECESYLSVKYGISLFYQSSGSQWDFLLLPLIMYVVVVLVFYLICLVFRKFEFSIRYSFSAINVVILYSSYFLSLVMF
jgi:hypothetical protein